MMKKIAVVLGLLIAGNTLHAQGFMNKMKNKISNAVDKTTGDKTSSASSGRAPNGAKYTDPSGFGTVVKVFSKKDVAAHMGGDAGGFSFLIQSVKVSGDQLQLVIGEYAGNLYSYSSGGQLQDMGKPAPVAGWADNYNGSEKDGFCKEFSNIDYGNTMTKTGPHISGYMVPGKPDRPYIFNGKAMGNFVTAFLSHNADSTVIGLVGQSYAGGKVVYTLVSSLGPKYVLPAMVMAPPLISADGRKMAALHQSANGNGYDVSFLDGKSVTMGNSAFGSMWISNNGSVFNIEATGSKVLDKNGVLFHTLDVPVDPHTLFISKDDNSIAWMGDHGLYFSNGDAFEIASSPYKITMNGKEQIIFIDVDIKNGNLYLCRHDL